MLKMWCPDRLRSWPALDGKWCHAVYTTPLKDVQGACNGRELCTTYTDLNIRTTLHNFSTDCGKSLSPQTKESTFPLKTVQHCWIQHGEGLWPSCWAMLNGIKRNLIAVKFLVQRYSVFLLFSDAINNVKFVVLARATMLKTYRKR